MKIAILGTGAYGLSLSLMFNENIKNIMMWTKFEEEKELLENTRSNEKLLPNIKIPDNIQFTTNMEECVKNADIILITVPAKFVDDIVKQLNNYYKENQHICIGSKGIEQDTCLFVSDVISKYINTNKLAVISGPSFAIDIASYVPIGLSVASTNKETITILKETLQNKYLKLRETDDVLGIEICGSIKNIMAIACGMLDGMGMPESTKAMFITESMHDIKELINALGGNKKTILSFAGIGDLLLTCTSTKSRNYSFGRLIGLNLDQSKVDNYLANTTVEGLYTLKSIYKLINDRKVDIPIIDMIYNIIFNDKSPNTLLKFLIEKE